MFLKSLEIHGFKSFADRTKLLFHKGVTGVVGPNGCGKSNIVDAIRWVLGETSAKALRGGEMADVIFNGTDKRQPLGMAEVTLTLGDCEAALGTEFNEVSFGRRVYRDGKSEYLINKSPCRLKDIHDLLSGTGIGRTSYSVMEQGKIDQLLSSKPEERRAVFEEAAGVTRFKQQRKEALRKLEYTEGNLERVKLIIDEVERQRRSVQRQAMKAKRYRAMDAEIRVLDLHLSHKLWQDYRSHTGADGSIDSLRQQQSELEASLEDLQAGLTHLRQSYQEADSRLHVLQAEVAQRRNEIQGASQRIESNGERIHEFGVLIHTAEADISNTAGTLERHEEELRDAEFMLSSIDDKIGQQQALIDEYQASLERVREQRKELSRQMSANRAEHSSLEGRLATLDARIEAGMRQMASDTRRDDQQAEELRRLQRDHAQRTAEGGELRAQLSSQREHLMRDEETLRGAEGLHQNARRDLEELNIRAEELHRLHTEKRSRLEVLRQLIAEGEGFEKGTQAVLRGLDRPDFYRKAVHGALSSYLEVDPACTPAIEAALGRHLQTLVVKDSRTVEAIITALKRGQLGQAALVAVNDIEVPNHKKRPTAPSVSLGWALDRVECAAEISSLIHRLLFGVMIVPNLSVALRLRSEYPGVAFATIEGEFVSAEGVIQGGVSGDGSGSILGRQSEVRELDLLSRELSTRLEDVENRRNRLAGRLDQLERTIQQKRDRLQSRRVSFSTIEGQLSLIAREIQQIDSKIETVQWERKELTERREEAEKGVAESRHERALAVDRLEVLTVEGARLRQELEQAEQLEKESNELHNEQRTSLAVERRARESVEQQRHPMSRRMNELRELLDRRQSEIAAYKNRIETCTAESAALLEKVADWETDLVEKEEELESFKIQRSRLTEEIATSEGLISDQRKEIQVIAEERSAEEVRQAQGRIRLENLEANVRQRYQAEIREFQPEMEKLHAVLAQHQGRGEVVRQAPPVHQEFEDEDGLEPGEMVSVISHPASPGIDLPVSVDWAFINEVVNQIRQKLDSMGPVNLDAILEFDELEQRYQFLTKQYEDLVNSREELLKVIAKINRDTRRIFGDTFEKIRVNFQATFRDLFGERGRADLLLMDDGDPLESGIDIIAKPPGKKLQSISLLSGGERSMTAVALLFAIYMVKPSPFCVLDELDAPLDEANISRFLQVLDRFIGQSQFIIVTHNKRTMSRADVMYGVSMEEFGVSKTVGMKFSANEERARERERSREALESAPDRGDGDDSSGNEEAPDESLTVLAS
ncbi:MAG: chromosome segregation protein SMC [Verrucomicrobiales bacterium]|nr:chromosome segregation protein SMC [Verrucomicrobiales bacterium]